MTGVRTSSIGCTIFALLLALQLGARPAHAQVRSVEGRVVHPDRARGDSSGMAPAASAWVTLHRVGKDNAGPIDSVRTDARGRYRLRWTPTGAADAVYFASATWAGIAYFTSPLRNAVTKGEEAEISVFDTTTRTFPMTVRGRHLIVSAADSASMRTVIEVFELSNDSVRALVAAEGNAPAPTWSIAVPPAARDPRASDGDISPDAFTFAPGRVSVFAPIAPGLKQLSFSYRVPIGSFPLDVVAEHGAVVFEVLLEEPQGQVSGAGFANVDAVRLEGRNFRRFLAQDVKNNAPVVVQLPASRAAARNLYVAGLLAGIGVLMLFALSRAMQRRTLSDTTGALAVRQGSAAIRAPLVPLHERVAQEIAALDATYSRETSPSDALRAAYGQRRAELLQTLTEALAEAPASR